MSAIFNTKKNNTLLLRYFVIAHQSLDVNVLKNHEKHNALQQNVATCWSILCVSSFVSTFITKLWWALKKFEEAEHCFLYIGIRHITLVVLCS